MFADPILIDSITFKNIQGSIIASNSHRNVGAYPLKTQTRERWVFAPVAAHLVVTHDKPLGNYASCVSSSPKNYNIIA